MCGDVVQPPSPEAKTKKTLVYTHFQVKKFSRLSKHPSIQFPNSKNYQLTLRTLQSYKLLASIKMLPIKQSYNNFIGILCSFCVAAPYEKQDTDATYIDLTLQWEGCHMILSSKKKKITSEASVRCLCPKIPYPTVIYCQQQQPKPFWNHY